jgi:bifunctional DNA-binding transcriptional regulator/antitoxin component of YhaV-PrlF toxin-antitoxin module
MEIDKKLLASLAFTLIVLGGMSTGTAAEAFGGNGEGGGKGMGGRGGMHRGGENALIPEELREELRAQHKDECSTLTEEERVERREEMKALRDEHKADMEEFIGLTHEEMRELHEDGKTMTEILSDQGITEDEAEEFLTEQAEKQVTEIVERHDLSSEQEQTLRDRIETYVQSILEKWFGNK